PEQPTPPRQGVSSFAKSLFLGEIHEDLVFPYPSPSDEERQRIRELVNSAREFGEHYDERAVEERRWIGDDEIRELGERGLMGLYVPREYGGAGLSQTGYCRVCEEFAQTDATLSVVMGVHQSIGMKGIVLFGTEDQKARFLPDRASGRKLAAFALTEPNAGADAYHLESRAEREAGGSRSGTGRSAPPNGCSTACSRTRRSVASSAGRWRTSSWCRTRSAGWSRSHSGSSRWRT